jgi:hypothetical protein
MVTHERAVRLAKFLKYISRTARTREEILAKLHIDLRCFYRDVKILRDREITIVNHGATYRLIDELEEARGKLPCPDPGLSIAELRQLAVGNSPPQRKLRRHLESIVGSLPSSNGFYRSR